MVCGTQPPSQQDFSAALTNLGLWFPLLHIQPQPLSSLGEEVTDLGHFNYWNFLNTHLFLSVFIPASTGVVLRG